jgi:serine/threonine-protein kinase
VTLGRAGLLLGCVFLLDALSHETLTGYLAEHSRKLQACGREIQEQLWETIGSYAPIRESKDLSNLGIAHGWAGLLYATLCWCAASGDPFPNGLSDRLHQLAECAEPVSRGLQWKWDLSHAHQPAVKSMSGWCNGSAGYVFLWTQAHKATGEERYLELAEGAAWHVWETPGPIGNLCCGMAGQAYALLNLHHRTGDAIWLRRARDTARGAAAAIEASRGNGPARLDARQESLYKGDMGIAVLAADLNWPEQGLMPMFERE